MRTDVGSIPLMCLLSTLTNGVFGYLPNEDLTNSVPNSILSEIGYPDNSILSGIEEEGGPPNEDENEPDGDSIYRKKSTFRRRNINSPFAGRLPFGRTAYKAGYGSNRSPFGMNSRNLVGFYERERNPFGTVPLQSTYQQPFQPEEYNLRPGPPYSGLIGGSRSGYYGSTLGLRRPLTPSGQRKGMLPNEYSPDYPPSNDLMSSFNNNHPIPSLRELATYASRYGPAYLRDRFGAAAANGDPSQPSSPFQPGSGPQIPSSQSSQGPRGGGGYADFSLNIASNQWNGGMGRLGMMTRDADSYQHDDVALEKESTLTSTTIKPKTKKKGKRAKKGENNTTKKPKA